MDKKDIKIRFAISEDVPMLYKLIKIHGKYDKASDTDLTLTEALLHKNIFEKKYAEILIAELNSESIGFLAFFHKKFLFNNLELIDRRFSFAIIAKIPISHHMSLTEKSEEQSTQQTNTPSKATKKKSVPINNNAYKSRCPTLQNGIETMPDIIVEYKK